MTRAIECFMGVSVVKGEGRVVRPREARADLLISNYSVIYWCDGPLSRSFELNDSKYR